MRGRDASVELYVASVDLAEDGIMESAGIIEVDVQLVVLSAVGDGNAGPDGGDIVFEDQSEPFTCVRADFINDVEWGKTDV